MVSGTQWPGGDPFLQRQNEPSMAVSSRHPMHLLAGANDYRTVDLPGVATDKPTGDAWLGLFKSFDGGATWRSTLVPGYPQDTSPEGRSSPLKGMAAAADPWIRSGSNGMFYYGGLAFTRDTDPESVIFVTRYIDDNNLEGGDTIRYLGTSVVAQGKRSTFLDKPSLIADIPRPGSPNCTIPAGPAAPAQTFAAGKIYVAYTEFTTPDHKTASNILVSESNDCGVTWSEPVNISGSGRINQSAIMAIDPNNGTLYVFWRVFASSKDVDSIAAAALEYGSKQFTDVVDVAHIRPFDQGTTDLSFRTNAFPAVAAGADGTLYITWTQRGLGAGGDARVVVLSARPVIRRNKITDLQAAGPVVIDPYAGRGHQIMPALAFSSGKLTAAWYDFRDTGKVATYTPLGSGQYSFELKPDGTIVFGEFVADPSPLEITPLSRRQTVDIRAAQAPPGFPAQFQPSVRVSQYAFGSPSKETVLRQLEFHPPNLPLFQRGTVPFVGDYIDIAGPRPIATAAGWRFNNLADDADHTHIVWTDNRNVIQPADGNWTNYTPVNFAASGPSVYDATEQRPACIVGQTGMRNQDIYTANLSQGLIMNVLGNDKPLTPAFQRQFAVTLRNTTDRIRHFRMSIGAMPPGGTASFLQFRQPGLPPVTQLDVSIPPYSTAARSVFVTSTNPDAEVPVTSQEIAAPHGALIPTGLRSSVVVNSDVSNPNISNPNISNVELYNPNISNPNISNPNISNPNISNPNISNPNISNITIANPNISNPNISNPNISNPNISNPNISNPNISNPNISNTPPTDVSYTVTNNGNTAATYTVRLLENQPAPPRVLLQLMVSGIYTTPVADGCRLTVQAHYVPMLNVTSPSFTPVANLLATGLPSSDAPTFALSPNEMAMVTIRAYIPSGVTYDPATAITPVIVSNALNTGTSQPSATLVITSVSLPPAFVGGLYNQALRAIGGTGSGFTWIPMGPLPGGLNLTAAGILQGTPATTGTFTIPVQVTDSGGNTARVTMVITINAPTLAITTTSLPDGTVGTLYSQSLAASGGTGTGYSWSTTTPLPGGLNLTAAGVLQGTPTTAGSSTITVQVTDSASTTASTTLSININNPPLTITTTSLPDGTAGTLYSQPLAASGGTGTGYSWSTTAPLPGGLNLTAAGVLQGTPTTAGSSTITVQVTDSASTTASTTLSININNPPLTITTTSLPDGTVGTLYSQSLAASGGTGTGYSWSATTPLPGGLNLTAVGVLQGTPTTAGSSTITVQVTDSASTTASTTLSININNPALTITSTSLPDGTVGTLYSQPLAASGGTGTGYSWTATTPLPGGLNLTAAGVLQGTPTTAGSSTITVQVTDSASTTASTTLSININNPPLTITTTSLPDGTVGTLYSQPLAASGGTGTGYSWTATTPLPGGLNLTAAGILQGTPTTAGTSTITVQVTDSASTTASTTLSININNPPLTITTASLPDATVGTLYSQPLAATGGTGTGYTWSATAPLPGGLNLTAAGVLQGTPTTAGTSTITVQVIDSASTTASTTLSININNPPLTITTTSLPDGTAGTLYSQPLAASGGTGTGYSWSTTAPLPGGLNLTAAGVLQGTPTTAGSSTITVQVTDSASTTASTTLSININNPALTITSTSLPDGTVGTLYSQPLAATGGTGTGYSWSTTAPLPGGLNLTAAGVLQGTPTTAGSSTITVQVTDSASTTASTTLSININNPPLTITTTSLPDGTAGTLYSQPLAASGGTGTGYSWSATAPLPGGLNLTAAGVLQGTPTTAGSSTITVQVTDSASTTASTTLSININNPPLTITTTSLPDGTAGTLYSQPLAASGGTGTGYSWTATTPLPGGLNLTAAGVLQGTPTTAGSSTITVQVTDSASTTASTTLSININNPPLTITTTSLPDGTAGTLYSQPLAASGGTGTGYSWTATTPLPGGLNLTAAGVLQGTPTTAGSSTITAQVTDSASTTASTTLSINIHPPLAITTASLPNGTVGSPYSQSLAASGGTGTGYTWSPTAPLPGGLSLTAAGVLEGTPTTAATTSISVQVTDSASNIATATIPIAIYTVLTITPTPLPNGTVGVVYSQSLVASGGTGTGYTWTPTAALPPGLSLTSGGVVQGTPATAGNFSVSVQVTDSASNLALASFPITIQAVLTITTTSLPDATVGTLYSQSLAASGGTETGYSWTATTPLPDGLNLTATGVLQGTPATAGNFSIMVQVTDSGANTANATLSLTIDYPPLTITTTSLPAGTFGVPYNQQLTAIGGTGIAYGWSETTLLPEGLNLTGDGILQGTPTIPGHYSITVAVSDSGDNMASATFSLTINNPPLTITTTSLANASAGAPYSQALSASGGTGTYSWAAISGLPPGMSVTSAGVLTGSTFSAGSHAITVEVTDTAAATTQATLNLTVLTPPQMSYPGSALSDATANTSYTQLLFTFGGVTPATWSATGLPPGIGIDSFDDSSGRLSGTPATPGDYTTTITVTGADGAYQTRIFTIKVNPPLSFVTTSPLPDRYWGVPYTQTFVASGGTAPLSYSLISGFLPGGFTFDGGGSLSATPQFPPVSNTYTLTIRVSDSRGAQLDQDFTITYKSLLTIPAVPDATLTENVAMTPITMTASGGTAPYTWSLNSGTLPAGVTLDPSGQLSGTPTSWGFHQVRFKVTDATGAYGISEFLNITVNP